MMKHSHLNQASNAIMKWWRPLSPSNGAPAGRPSNAGARARLRRAASMMQVYTQPETHALIQAVREALGEEAWPKKPKAEAAFCDRLALVAMVLPHVKSPATADRDEIESKDSVPEDQAGKEEPRLPRFAKILGMDVGKSLSREEERPLMSPIRFGGVMRSAGDAERFVAALRRALALVHRREFDQRRFVRDLLSFDDQVRRDWTFDYYQTPRREPVRQDTTEIFEETLS